MRNMPPGSKAKQSLLTGAVVVSAAASSQGAMVYFTPATPFSATATATTAASIYIDVDAKMVSTTANGGIDEILYTVGSASSKPYLNNSSGGSTLFAGGQKPFGAPGNEITRYAAGDTMAVPSITSGTITWGSDGIPAYAGFSFTSGTSTLYGWALIGQLAAAGIDPNSSADDTRQITFYGAAYDDAGSQVIAGGGAIPEPSTSVMVAAALAGSATMFRRRQSKLAAA